MPNRKLIGFTIFALIIIEIGTVASHWGDVVARRPDFAALYSAARLLRHAADEVQSSPVTRQDSVSPISAAVPADQGMVADTLHPPFEMLVFLPLSYLPYQTAYLCWLC